MISPNCFSPIPFVTLASCCSEVTAFALLSKTASAQKWSVNLGVSQESCTTKAVTFTALIHEISQNTGVYGYYAGKKKLVELGILHAVLFILQDYECPVSLVKEEFPRKQLQASFSQCLFGRLSCRFFLLCFWPRSNFWFLRVLLLCRMCACLKAALS